jgi:hypothetical protein
LVTDVSTGKVFVGTDTARTTFYDGAFGAQVQIEGLATTSNYIGLSIVANSNNANGGFLALGSTRGTAVNATTVLQAGDALGALTFQGSDGSNMISGADIFAEVLSGVGANDMPTKLILRTNSGTTAPVERMKIQHTSGNNVVIADGLTLTDGDLIIGGSGHGIDFSAGASGASSSNLLDEYEEGTWTPAFVSGLAPDGTVSSLAGQYVKVGKLVTVYMQVAGSSLNLPGYARVQGLPFTASTSNASGTYILGGIAHRNHGWTTLASGSDQWYFSVSGSDSEASMSASITYKTN